MLLFKRIYYGFKNVISIGKGFLFSKKEESSSITLFFTGDEHSYLTRFSEKREVSKGGLNKLSALLKTERDKVEKSILVSSGDFISGSPFGWLVTKEEKPTMDLLSDMGYEAITLGNHEFDYGTDKLFEILKAARRKEKSPEFIASNLRFEKNDLNFRKILTKRKIFKKGERGSIKVGVLGLMGEKAKVNIPTELEVEDPIKSGRKISKKLNNEGINLIIALFHAGMEECKKLAEKSKNIDVIVGGHSHEMTENIYRKSGTIIVQAGSEAKHLGKLELEVGVETGKVRSKNEILEEPVILPATPELAENPEIMKKIDYYENKLNNYLRNLTEKYENCLEPVVESSFEIVHEPDFSETPAGNLVTDAMRLETQKVANKKVDIAAQTNGSIRKGLSSDLPEKKVSLFRVLEMVGVRSGGGRPGDSIALIYLTGKEIWKILEMAVLVEEVLGNDSFLQMSGVKYSYRLGDAVLFTIPFLDESIPTGKAVKSVEIYCDNGLQPKSGSEYKKIKKDKSLYSIAINTKILSRLIDAGKFHPGLNITPKKENGRKINRNNLEEMIVRKNGEEYKVWEALLSYLKKYSGRGVPDYYNSVKGRINPF